MTAISPRRTPPAWREPAHNRLTEVLEVPMLVVSIAFVVVLIWPVVDPNLSEGTQHALFATNFALWAAFALEYFALLVTAPSRWLFVRTHVFDLLLVAIPLLRPLRIMRAGRALRLLRLGGLFAALGTAIAHSRGRFVSTTAISAAAFGTSAVLLGAASVLDAERDNPDANIHTFGDAVWWAITTVTTVGYGDRYPVTGTGRVIAGVLVFSGVALLGIVTAAIAAWFISFTQPTRPTEDLRDQVAALTGQVEALRMELAASSRQRPDKVSSRD